MNSVIIYRSRLAHFLSISIRGLVKQADDEAKDNFHLRVLELLYQLLRSNRKQQVYFDVRCLLLCIRGLTPPALILEQVRTEIKRTVMRLRKRTSSRLKTGTGCKVPIFPIFFLFLGGIPIFSYLFKKTSYFSYFLVHGTKNGD